MTAPSGLAYKSTMDRAKLEEIFRVVLDLDDGADVSGLARGLTPKWDSLAQVTLVAALEDEFDVAFDIADYAGMETFEGVAHTLARRLERTP